MTATTGGLVGAARTIASAAHAGQVDKNGAPYVGHPAAVAALLERQGASEVEVAAGWLHDVVEDTDVNLDDLRRDLSPYATPGDVERVCSIVDLLTRRPHEPSGRYYERIAADPQARAVKLADIAHNTDPARMALVDAADPTTADRLRAKYARAVEALR